MKIVRKINLIQGVSVVSFVAMVLVAMILLKNISAHVAELTEEDMAMERQIGVINEAYLRQMVAVDRSLRLAMEATAEAHEAMQQERHIFEAKGEELGQALAETQALISELQALNGDADPSHAEEMAYLNESVQQVVADSRKYEELSQQIFALIDQGRLHQAGQFIEEAGVLANEISELLHQLDAKMESAVILAVEAIQGAEDMLLEDMIIAAVISILAALGLGTWISLGIRNSLAQTNSTIGQIIQERNLALRLPENRDELGEMGRCFNGMLDDFQQVLREMIAAATQLAASAEELSAVTEESSAGVQKQSSETDQVATAMNEMSASLTEVASNTSSAAVAAGEADQQANDGRQVVLQSIDVINELAAEVDKAAAVIAELSVDSQNIGSVMDVILGVAEQTNLLALNAAIEAARAGEQGRGFAVVADEVRTLAQRTQESTSDIQQTIERLQKRADSAVAAMQAGKSKAEEGVAASSRADESLASIATSVTTINDMMTQIASAAEEQSAVAEEINCSLTAIRDVASDVSLGANQTAQASNDIAHLAVNMQEMVARFKL